MKYSKLFAESKDDIINDSKIEFNGKEYQRIFDSIYEKLEDRINQAFRDSVIYNDFQNISDIVKLEPPDFSANCCYKNKDGQYYIPSYINIQVPSISDIDGTDIMYKGEILSKDNIDEATDDLSRICIPIIQDLIMQCPFIDSVNTDTSKYFFTLWVNIKKLVYGTIESFSENNEEDIEINDTDKINPDLKNYINSVIRKEYNIGHGKHRDIRVREKYLRDVVNSCIKLAKEYNLNNSDFRVNLDIAYTLGAFHEIPLNEYIIKLSNYLTQTELYIIQNTIIYNYPSIYRDILKQSVEYNRTKYGLQLDETSEKLDEIELNKDSNITFSNIISVLDNLKINRVLL